MKRSKHHAVGVEALGARRDGEVQREIETFLRALSSYPDRFARDPYLSFEQHLGTIASASQPATADAGRHRD